MNGNVAIDGAVATSRIAEIYAETESFFSEMESGYTKLSESIIESQGEFIEAIKIQINNEWGMVSAACDFFKTLLQMMQKADEDFEALDEAYAKTKI